MTNDTRPTVERFDDDGYPTEEALALLERWDWHDLVGWFAFARSLWRYPEYWNEKDAAPGVALVYASTGGWSGNESVMDAMCKNPGCWSITWQQTTRGGHYRFEYRVPTPKEGTNE